MAIFTGIQSLRIFDYEWREGEDKHIVDFADAVSLAFSIAGAEKS